MFNKYLPSVYYAPGAGNTAVSNTANILSSWTQEDHTHKYSHSLTLVRAPKLEGRAEGGVQSEGDKGSLEKAVVSQRGDNTAARPRKGWGTVRRPMRLEGSEQEPSRGREEPKLSPVGLGGFCWRAMGAPQEGSGQRRNVARFSFPTQHSGHHCVKRKEAMEGQWGLLGRR